MAAEPEDLHRLANPPSTCSMPTLHKRKILDTAPEIQDA